MLVAVDVVNPGDARPEFGLGSDERLQGKKRWENKAIKWDNYRQQPHLHKMP